VNEGATENRGWASVAEGPFQGRALNFFVGVSGPVDLRLEINRALLDILNAPSSVNAMISSWQNCRSGEVERDSGK
jgi:hypothetical protein